MMMKPDLLAATTVVHIPDLAQALCSLFENPERRRAMGEAGQKRAKELYDWPVVVAAYEQLWTELSAPIDCQRHQDSAWPTLDEFRYQQIFDHYPTDTFSEDVHVRVSPSARHFGDRYEWVDKTMHAARWFKRELFSAIMGELQPRGNVRVRTLVDVISDGTDTGRVVVLTHVWRLMKYGLIEPVDCAR